VARGRARGRLSAGCLRSIVATSLSCAVPFSVVLVELVVYTLLREVRLLGTGRTSRAIQCPPRLPAQSARILG
jgi:hypothetical protein